MKVSENGHKAEFKSVEESVIEEEEYFIRIDGGKWKGKEMYYLVMTGKELIELSRMLKEG